MRMEPMRRLRATAAMACCLLAALAGGWKDEGGDAVDRLRTEVGRQAAALREELDRAEREQDWGELLAKKAAVDAILAPLHLVRDAMEAAQDPRPGAPVDLLRSLRVEWRDAPVRSSWCDAATAERAREWLRSWTPPPGESRSYRVRVATERWVGLDAPPLADWTIDASWADGAPLLEARCECLLPAADPRRVAFPLPVDGFTIRWDGEGAAYADAGGRAHHERWDAAPLFNNPPDVYAAFDGLRLVRAADHAAAEAPRDDFGARAGASPAVSDRLVHRADGSLVRLERWAFRDGRVEAIHVEQRPLSLVHHAPQGAEIVTEVGGAEESRAAHRPRTELPMPAMRWSLESAAPGGPPIRWTLWSNGQRAAHAEFAEAPPRAGGDGPAPGDAPTLAGDAGAARAMIDRAIDTQSAPLLLDASAVLDRLHAVHRIPEPQRAADRRLLLERSTEAGMGDAAAHLPGIAPDDAPEFPRPDAGTLEAMRAAWDTCAREALAAFRESIRAQPPGEGVSSRATDAMRELRRRLDGVRAVLGTATAAQFDAALPGPPPPAEPARRRMRSMLDAALGRESRRSAVVRELLGERLGDARADAAMRRAVDAALNAVTDEYLRWTASVSVAEPRAVAP